MRGLLAELAERIPVRVIVWAGGALPVFKPTRAAVREGREDLVAGPRSGACSTGTSARPTAITRSS